EGLPELEALVRARLDQRSALFDVLLPMNEGRFESRLRSICQPLEDDWDEARNLRRLRVRLTEGALGSLRRGQRHAGRAVVRLAEHRERLARRDDEFFLARGCGLRWGLRRRLRDGG